jgi:hypothetical protein
MSLAYGMVGFYQGTVLLMSAAFSIDEVNL